MYYLTHAYVHIRVSQKVISSIHSPSGDFALAQNPKLSVITIYLLIFEIKHVNGQRGLSSGKNHEKPVNISGQKLSRTRGAKKA